MPDSMRRVEVVWRDSMSRIGWDSREEHRQMGSVGPCVSVGYVLESNADVVQLAQSWSHANENVADVITIPRECIVSMDSVSPARTRKK